MRAPLYAQRLARTCLPLTDQSSGTILFLVITKKMNRLKQKTLAPRKSPSAILYSTHEIITFGKTSHFHRAVSEHRPAGLGIHQWAASGKVRSFVYRARGMRRSLA